MGNELDDIVRTVNNGLIKNALSQSINKPKKVDSHKIFFFVFVVNASPGLSH